jgi:hypothetical protein
MFLEFCLHFKTHKWAFIFHTSVFLCQFCDVTTSTIIHKCNYPNLATYWKLLSKYENFQFSSSKSRAFSIFFPQKSYVWITLDCFESSSDESFPQNKHWFSALPLKITLLLANTIFFYTFWEEKKMNYPYLDDRLYHLQNYSMNLKFFCFFF